MADGADGELNVAVRLTAEFSQLKEALTKDIPDAFREAFGQAKTEVEDKGKEVSEAAGKVGEEAGSKLSDGFKLLAASFGTQFIDSVKESIEKAAQFASSLGTMSIATGATVVDIQKLQYAMSTVGVNAESARASLYIFERQVANMAERSGKGNTLLERMGLDPKAFKAKDLTSQMEIVADKIKDLNPSSKVEVAKGLFGINGAQMLSIFNEGSEGIKKLTSDAVAMGGIMGGDVREKFEHLHGALTTLSQSAMVFYASFAAPFIDGIVAIIQGIERLYGQFEKLDEGIKKSLVIGALIATFASIEGALESLRGVFISLKLEGLVKVFTALAGPINALVGVIAVLYAAWLADFGGIRSVMEQVGASVGYFVDRAKGFFESVWHLIQDTLVPALQNLSDAFRPVVKALGDVFNAVLRNTDIWLLLYVIISEKIQLLAGIINGFATVVESLVKNFDDVKGAVVALAGVLTGIFMKSIAQAAGALMLEMRAALVAIYEEMWLIIKVAIPEMILAFKRLMFSNPILAFIQLLFIAISIAIGVVIANWKAWHSGVETFGAQILNMLSKILGMFADWAIAIGKLLEHVPGFELMGLAIEKVGDATKYAADRAKDWADALDRAAKAKHDTSEADFNNRENWKPVPKEKKEKKDDHGGLNLDLKPRTTHKNNAEAIREDIENIKRPQEALKEAIKDTEFEIKKAEIAFKKLGEIDTLPKLKLATQDLTKEQRESNILAIEYKRLAHEQAREAKVFESREASYHKKDPKVARQYHAEYVRAHDESRASLVKFEEEQLKSVEIDKKRHELAVAYYKAQAEIAPGFAQRISMLNNELAVLLRLKGHQKDRLDVEKLINETIAAREDVDAKQAKYASDMRGAERTRTKDLRNLNVYNPNDIAQQRADKETGLGEDVVTAKENVANLSVAMANAKEDYEREQASLRKKLAKEEDVIKAHQAYEASVLALYDANTKLAVAQKTLANAQAETTIDVQTVRDKLKALASQVAGPLMETLDLMQKGVNPLAAIFLSLFQQSKAFNDIMRVMKEIFAALAQVFDAARPIIDLFLGVIIGITNIFLTLYNVVATLLNVFGLHIQKIKLVNDSLQSLSGQAVPLLQITHDLPTANEYNDGKWGPLIAKQEQNANNLQNNLDQNFSKQFERLGSILGTLIGIKVILGLLGVKGAFGDSGGGPFGFITGLFNKIFKTGGGGASVPGVPGNESSFDGTWDSASPSTGAGATTDNSGFGIPGYGQDTTAGSLPLDQNTVNDALGSGGTYDATTQSNFGSGGVADKMFQANVGEGSPLLASLSKFSGLLPGVLSMLGVGGPIGAIIGAVPGLITSFGRAATGASNTAGYVNSALEIFRGLSKGGTFSETLGGIGGAVGTFFGGPFGAALGSALGSLIGGLFGPHLSAFKNPDILDTERYGSDTANLLGHAGANGHEFDEDPRLKQLFNGDTGIAAIEKTLAKYGSAANAPDWLKPMFNNLKSIFGLSADGSGQLKFGKNIGDQHIEGAAGTDGQVHRYDEIASALNAFASAFGAGGGASGGMFANATNIDLASVYGNGVSQVPGGYAVNPQGGSTASAPATVTNQFIVNIGTVTGLDKTSLTTAFDPIFKEWEDKLGRQQQIQARTLSTQTGRDSYA